MRLREGIARTYTVLAWVWIFVGLFFAFELNPALDFDGLLLSAAIIVVPLAIIRFFMFSVGWIIEGFRDEEEKKVLFWKPPSD